MGYRYVRVYRERHKHDAYIHQFVQGPFGPALDNVTIADAAVPEPASAGLFLVGAMLILAASLLPRTLKQSDNRSR